MLLSHGARIDAARGDRLTPYALAVRSGNRAAADALAAAGADTSRLTALDRLLGACLEGNAAEARAIVRANPTLVVSMDDDAARALGVSDWTIMRRHLFPNAMVSTLTFMPFILSGSVTTLTALDFLGFGLPPGSPSLGEMLNQAKGNLGAPWLSLSALIVISLMLVLLIFIGEAIRDAFDPRKTFA